MTKLDKFYLHNFGTTYSALIQAEAPHSSKLQLVDDLWEKIQAEFAPEESPEPATDGSKPSEMPGPPAGDAIYRIHNSGDGTVWSHRPFLTHSAALHYLVNHYEGTANYLSRKPSQSNFWGHKYEIREIND
jgi:hypothetical protein